MRLFLAASLLALSAASVHAETFTVTRTDDPLPDACAPGDCSLREAMIAANANDPFAGEDEIVLGTGTYVLIRGALSNVNQNLLVHGVGSASTRIESDAALFTASGQRVLRLQGMTLAVVDEQDAYVNAIGTAGGTEIDDVVVEAGTVSLGSTNPVASRIGASEFHDAVTLSGNARVALSLFTRTLYVYGEALLEDSTIFNLYQMPPQQGAPAVTLRRTTVDGTLYPGAPLASTITVHRGSLSIEDSVLTDTVLRYAGIADVDISGTTITRSEIVDATAGSSLTLRRVRYLDNTGPIRTEAAIDVTITDSLFENNTVRALYAAGGAQWNVSGSSFVKNRVDGNAGGAIVLEDDTVLRIRNSTFSGNTFSAAAAANGARGAAIGYRHGDGAHLIVVHSTIVAPDVMPPGTVGSAIGGHDNRIAVDIANSIVRGSCGMNAHLLQNNSGDIESPGNTCGLDTEQNNVNVSSTSLALGALADNGGPTPTILPGAGSLAIDRASTPQCLPTDQRGYARPGGARCDIGAVETDADDTLFADGFED